MISLLRKTTSLKPMVMRMKTAAAFSTQKLSSDILIIGTGVAGTAAAIRASQLNPSLRITLLTSEENPASCNSYWAQGGIIYKGKEDSPSLLASDIHTAGANVCDEVAVNKVATEGPAAVENLLLNVAQTDFEREGGNLKLTLEASHSTPRIIYQSDCTGKFITNSLLSALPLYQNINVVPSSMVTSLNVEKIGNPKSNNGNPKSKIITGARVLNTSTKERSVFTAPNVILATGGCGSLYQNTSNPAGALGSGLALGIMAGVSTRNMEYMQFHPTTLYVPHESRFLMTEALRGEGAILKNHRGEAFAKSYHPDGELAPRDVVARMILSEMEAEGKEHMYLDISHRDSDWLKSRFPTIASHTASRGFDFTSSALPVVPAAHYHCGGLSVDPHTGETLEVSNLYAAGEVACTGLHGANRLASTSLLEGLVYGSSIAETIVERSSSISTTTTTLTNVVEEQLCTNDTDVSAYLQALQETMWSHVGPVRTSEGLQLALREIKKNAALNFSGNEIHSNRPEVVALSHALVAAEEITRAAINAKSSIGTHFLQETEEGAIAAVDEQECLSNT